MDKIDPKSERVLKQSYFVFLVVLFIVFTAGIIVGKGFKVEQSSELSRFLKESELSTESYILERDLISNDETGCDIAKIRIKDLSNELYRIGKRLTEEDSQSSISEKEYEYLKRKYHLMQIRTYFLFSKLREDCNTSTNIILYYFGSGDAGSSKQGVVLDKIAEDYDVDIFAIEYNYSPELNFLERFYNITATPALVINYGKKVQGFTGYEQIKAMIS